MTIARKYLPKPLRCDTAEDIKDLITKLEADSVLKIEKIENTRAGKTVIRHIIRTEASEFVKQTVIGENGETFLLYELLDVNSHNIIQKFPTADGRVITHEELRNDHSKVIHNRFFASKLCSWPIDNKLFEFCHVTDVCPIRGANILIPKVAPDGNTYESHAISLHVSQKKKLFTDDSFVSIDQLLPNIIIEQMFWMVWNQRQQLSSILLKKSKKKNESDENKEKWKMQAEELFHEREEIIKTLRIYRDKITEFYEKEKTELQEKLEKLVEVNKQLYQSHPEILSTQLDPKIISNNLFIFTAKNEKYKMKINRVNKILSESNWFAHTQLLTIAVMVFSLTLNFGAVIQKYDFEESIITSLINALLTEVFVYIGFGKIVNMRRNKNSQKLADLQSIQSLNHHECNFSLAYMKFMLNEQTIEWLDTTLPSKLNKIDQRADGDRELIKLRMVLKQCKPLKNNLPKTTLDVVNVVENEDALALDLSSLEKELEHLHKELQKQLHLVPALPACFEKLESKQNVFDILIKLFQQYSMLHYQINNIYKNTSCERFESTINYIYSIASVIAIGMLAACIINERLIPLNIVDLATIFFGSILAGLIACKVIQSAVISISRKKQANNLNHLQSDKEKSLYGYKVATSALRSMNTIERIETLRAANNQLLFKPCNERILSINTDITESIVSETNNPDRADVKMMSV